MTNRGKLVEKINKYCSDHETEIIEGSENIFLNELSEYENKQTLKELAYGEHKVIEFDEFQCKATQLPVCRSYFRDNKTEWLLKWLPHILAGLLIFVTLITGILSLLLK